MAALLRPHCIASPAHPFDPEQRAQSDYKNLFDLNVHVM
jgi:hypothetical protein